MAVVAQLMCLALLSPAWAASASQGPYTRKDPATGQQITPDANAIHLENEHLKLAIMTAAPHSGQVFSLVYKPTGQELGNPFTLQGYWQDRGVPGKVVEGQGRIVSQDDNAAQAEVVYVTRGQLEGKEVAIRHTKTYTLQKGASFIRVAWKQENIGSEKVQYNPWIKHVGGSTETFLGGPARIVMPQGPTKLEWNFEPALNWVVRLSGEADSEQTPMVVSLTDFRRIFRQSAWQKVPRWTLETTLTRVDLAPGESTQLPSVLLVTPNLGAVSYAAPELAASLAAAGEVKAGQETSLKLKIAAGLDLGEKRLEGQIVSAAGAMVAKLPNQQVTLQAGKISELAYSFNPPSDGVYFVKLRVFDRQTPIMLGEIVASQETAISVPVVVGTPPEVVVRRWESEDKGFAGRPVREVKPWRTLLNSPGLQAGQVLVPERIFPEDKFTFGSQVEPAFVRLAGGEYECLQFAVQVPEGADATRLAVELSPIRSEQGVALDRAQLREQIYLTTEIPSDYMDFPVGQWPDPLFEPEWQEKIAAAPITRKNQEFIKKIGRRVYWLTLRAQPDAAPGLYKGAVKLALAGKALAEFPVEVQVSGFSLPRRPYFRCNTGMVGWRGNKPDNWKLLGLPEQEIASITKNALDSYRRLMLEYGWTPTMYFGDRKTWEQYVDVGRGPSVYSTNNNKANEQWLIEKGLLKYAFHYAPFDEHTDGKVPEVVEWAKQWKAKTSIPILDCFYGRNVEPLFGLVDVWLGQDPRNPWWGEPTAPLGWGHKAVERKKAGDQFFSCNASLIWHVEFEPAQGRSQFWEDFVAGVDGRYVYSTPRWTDDVYAKNWTTGNYMGCVVYPGPNGLTTSIRLETLRDSVEDYDYLALLRESLEKGRPTASADVVARAEAVLNDPKLAAKVKTAGDIHTMRNQVADLIERLKGGVAAK